MFSNSSRAFHESLIQDGILCTKNEINAKVLLRDLRFQYWE